MLLYFLNQDYSNSPVTQPMTKIGTQSDNKGNGRELPFCVV